MKTIRLHKIKNYQELILAKEKTKYAMLIQEKEIGTHANHIKYDVLEYFRGTLYEVGQQIVSYLIVKLVKD